MAEKADSEGYAAARSFAMFTELASPASRALLVRCDHAGHGGRSRAQYRTMMYPLDSEQ
jgi:hypothetical protein